VRALRRNKVTVNIDVSFKSEEENEEESVHESAEHSRSSSASSGTQDPQKQKTAENLDDAKPVQPAPVQTQSIPPSPEKKKKNEELNSALENLFLKEEKLNEFLQQRFR
jgi:hypothetical protein